MGPVNLAAMSANVARAELEMVRAFRASTATQFAWERLGLTKATVEGDSDSQYEDFLADQYVVAEEIHELSEELAVVAAYRVVELNAKRLAFWLDKTYQQFYWPSFSRLLVAKAKVGISALDGASSVDELRLLNNAIKHEGKVTEELAHYPGWTLGERVHPVGPAFERLSPAVPIFVEALARAILPVKLGGNRPDSDVFPPKQGVGECTA